MSKDASPTNRLRSETSPYLLQHAANPVDWYPWCEEALSTAKAEDKPILLSIGYSACHWCHVMAHESFEDPETARVMNELFVNIKVDREERPDLDKIYQLAHQLLTHRPGGWPLTVFLDPHNQLPFFAGTYFPRRPRFRLPSFIQIVQKVAAYYRENQTDLEQHQAAFRDILDSLTAQPPVAGELDENLLVRAEDTLGENFDPVSGGFGQAPKFPHASDLQFLQDRCGNAHPVNKRNRQIVETTLTQMALGGIYDQLGGGFYRYSVDARWEIPHFEKMLYDNGPLLHLFAKAWLATGNPLFRRVIEETVAWVMREMQSPDGAYYASLDADSEGVEGKYYVWDRQEVRSLLLPSEYAVFEKRFGLNEAPNFEGHWHLHVEMSVPQISEKLSIAAESADENLTKALQVLVRHRSQRVRPGRDEKILVAWNALMIKGLAAAGRILGRQDFIAAAFQSFDFLRRCCWQGGRLRAVWKDGRAALDGYLDDYVMLIDACLELLQAEWRSDVLAWATELADCTLAQFEDPIRGGFFFTAQDHERLIYRPKPLMDESLPSGNGVAISVLARLGFLLGVSRYLDAAERGLNAALPAMQRYPEAHGSLLRAFGEWLNVPRLVVLRGKSPVLELWRDAIMATPNCLCFAIPEHITDLPGLLAERQPLRDTVAYLCTGRACLPPVQSLDALKAELAGGG